MIWAVPDVIAYVSRSVELKAGDLIFTGTPAGVGALQPGDRVTGGVDGVATFDSSWARSRKPSRSTQHAWRSPARAAVQYTDFGQS